MNNDEPLQLPALGRLKCDLAKVRVGWYCHTHNAHVFDCLECGRFYHTNRSDSRYCSSACRQRAYRRRKSIEKASYTWDY